jgi:putative transposase
VDNPRHYRKAEKRLKHLHRQLSRKKQGSKNRQKARKQANALVSSHDLIAYEHLQIRTMVRNRHLAKSIHDAGWGIFLHWLNYYGLLHDISIIAVPPHYTSQNCSQCGTQVKKSLSVRTHVCYGCGVVLDRDHNAALNILQKALDGTVGQAGTDGHVP